MAMARQSWWDKFITPRQIIRDEPGEKVALIMMPRNGPFAGYKMWYPKSLIKYGCPHVALRCGSKMTFKLFNGEKEISMDAISFMRVQTCGD